MRSKPLKFKFFGIDVFIPFSGWVGLLLIAYFALPTSMNLLDQTEVDVRVILLALAHGLAIYLTIFVHELGHVIAAKKLRYDVQGVFLHLFGGHTSFLGKYNKPSDQFLTAGAGPLFTLFVSAIAFVVTSTTDGLVNSVATWLLWSSFVITVVNLLPGVPLDGGSIFASLVWKVSGNKQLGQRFAGYGGYAVAILWMTSPFLMQYFFGWQVTQLDIFFSSFIGVWLFVSARLTVRMSKNKEVVEVDVDTFHTLKVKDLARRAVSVDTNSSLGDAITLMKSSQAGSVLLTKEHEIVGVVLEKFLQDEFLDSSDPVTNFATRTNRRDWVNFNELIAHNQKIDPTILHGQWVVVDDDGAIYGILHRSDIAQRIDN